MQTDCEEAMKNNTQLGLLILCNAIILSTWLLLCVDALPCNDDVNNTIIDGPHNMTVFQNQTVTFLCTIEHENEVDTNWDINGTRFWFVVSGGTLTDGRNDRNNRTYDYWFFLPAKDFLNNSLVQCKYTRINVPVWRFTCSHNATLTIQGPPEAVSDFSVSVHNMNHMLVTWTAPFTLDVTGVEYDITYSLIIINITNETEPMIVECVVCHNLTQPHFNYSPLNPLPGHSFNFTVTPINGAGIGPSSHTLTATLSNNTHGISLSVIPSSSYYYSGTNSRDSDNSGIIYGVLASTVFLVVMMVTIITLINIILCHRRFSRNRSKSSDFEMTQNQLYCSYRKSNFEMQHNPLYAITHTKKEPSSSLTQTQHNTVYETIDDLPVQQLISEFNTEDTALQTPAHNEAVFDETSRCSDVIKMQQNQLYDYGMQGPIKTDKNIAYQTVPVLQ